jgi:hypothetical protein
MHSRLTAHRVVAVFGLAIGAAALACGLPLDIPPSIRIGEDGIVWLGAPLAAFLLPLAALVTDALLRGLRTRHPVSGSTSATVLPVYDAIMLRCTAGVVGVHVMVLATLSGWIEGQAWVAPVVPLILGTTLVGVGNLCPQLEPNLALGVRTQRTLSDRGTWRRVHRGLGYLIVGCGVLTIASTITVAAPFGPRMILVAGPLALIAGGLFVRRVACVAPHRS